MITSEPIQSVNVPGVLLNAKVAPVRRLRRLRVAWFILGSLFGYLIAYYSLAHFHSQDYSKLHGKTPIVASTLKNSVSQAVSNTAYAIADSVIPAANAATTDPKSRMQLPINLNIAVKRGDTLLSMLTERGIAPDEARTIVQSMKKIYNPHKITAGQSLQLYLDRSHVDMAKPSVKTLSIAISPLKTINVSRITGKTTRQDAFVVKEVQAPVFTTLVHIGSVINSSLYQTAENAGLPANMILEIINALSYDVDFQRDIHEGDRLDVVFERFQTEKGVTAGFGNIQYISLNLDDKELHLYRHSTKEGYSGYYNSKGESVKKALLKTPINGAHITSSFGMRMHPLLGYSKMHKGIDFGAVTGTPIYAAGDGVIDEAGRKGGYGNYLRIKHNNNYATAYGHASRIAKGIHKGVHVRQGQVIAYVGSTGQSTGPHLHYEILANGAQVNPSGVKFRTGQTLGGKELAEFKTKVKKVATLLAAAPGTPKVALK